MGRKKNQTVRTRCKNHFENIYGEEGTEECMRRLESLLYKYGLGQSEKADRAPGYNWDHSDQILITYADMVQSDIHEEVTHLGKQHQFLNEYLSGLLSSVHILPFFPSSSDDGFSVVDYRSVDPQAGSWKDIESMGRDYRLMADLVMNHVSKHSYWFRQFLQKRPPYNRYFIEVDNDSDLSDVTRPRSTPLVTSFHTTDGESLVWTTFSNDQMDVNFSNPDVLFEYLDIFMFYVQEGLRVIRLDAVAFIWKEIGTTCIHLPRTHEIIKLIRTLVDCTMPQVTLITETNVPHRENISYFGEGDEAHMVYQFSLPPLLLHAILTQNGSYLTEWAASLGDLPDGCTYLNFTSSHDGIGVRPLEGLVPENEFMNLVKGMEERGGFVSYREKPDRTRSPYELNITYYDAFKSLSGESDLQEKRYFCSQLIMLSLLGVPGIYFHNLTGTSNNLQGVRMTGRFRTINRKKWKYDELVRELENPDTRTSRIFSRYCDILKVRNRLAAFHPMGQQNVYDTGDDLFCVERTDPDQTESLLVVANVTGERVVKEYKESGLPLESGISCRDELSGEVCVKDGSLWVEPYQVLWIRTNG